MMHNANKHAVLITGTGGFAGRNLAAYLAKKFEVLAPTRSELNLLDWRQVQDFFGQYPGIQTVIHCAVVGGSRFTSSVTGAEQDVVEKNLRMFGNLIRCLRSEQKLIHMGSGGEYAREGRQPKLSEACFDQAVPADSYSFAKYAISKHIDTMPNAICLRIFGLYGQYEDYRWKFISNAIVKNLLGLPITVAQNVKFDYLYIRDFVQLVTKIMGCDSWPYRHINITPSESIDLVRIAELINEISGKPSEIRVLCDGWNIPYTASNQRLLEMTGPFQFTSYADGIRELMQYYRHALPSLDSELIKQDHYLQHCQSKLAVTKA